MGTNKTDIDGYKEYLKKLGRQTDSFNEQARNIALNNYHTWIANAPEPMNDVEKLVRNKVKIYGTKDLPKRAIITLPAMTARIGEIATYEIIGAYIKKGLIPKNIKFVNFEELLLSIRGFGDSQQAIKLSTLNPYNQAVIVTGFRPMKETDVIANYEAVLDSLANLTEINPNCHLIFIMEAEGQLPFLSLPNKKKAREWAERLDTDYQKQIARTVLVERKEE